MPDIQITWDVANSRGDWTLIDGALATGSDLQNAILISLFTDKLASTDFKLTDGSDDRRGWWGDDFGDPGDGQIGSDLWQLERSKKTNSLLPQAKQFCADALQWLVDDGVVARFDIVTEWQNGKRLAIGITAFKPDGTSEKFGYQWAWAALGV